MKATALSIIYDNHSSEEFNVLKVDFNDGFMKNETLIPTRNINKVKRQNSNIVDFYSIDNSPLSFPIDLFFDGILSEDDKVAIVQWLVKNTYKPLSFSTMPNNIYYAIATSVDLSHNTLQKGYFTVNFECNAPWAFTKVLSTNKYTVNSSTSFTVRSNSVFETSIVKVEVTMLADDDLLIENKTNQTELRFTQLANGTKITIDCFNHSLNATDGANQIILINDKKVNYKWLTLSPGNNAIEVTGNCEIKIYWQGIKI